MENSGYNSPSQDFKNVGGDNLVDLICHVVFDIDVICQGHQKGIARVSVCQLITRIRMVISICHEYPFGVMVIREEIFFILVTTLRHILIWL